MLHGYPLVKELCGGLQVSRLILKPCQSVILGSGPGGGHSATTRFRIPGCVQAFMEQHGFNSIEEFRGQSLEYFTTHTELVRMQREAIAAKRAQKVGLSKDDEWSGDGFVKESESMVSNA